jgi:hypothetical protein
VAFEPTAEVPVGQQLLLGDLVRRQGSGTYLCTRTHDSGLFDENPDADPPHPGPHDPLDDTGSWQKLPADVSAPDWWLNEDERQRWFGHSGSISSLDRGLVRETYYDDALTLVSLGRDGAPGGKGLDADLVLAVYPEEYTGEVAGHAGYSGRHANSVTLYHPAYTDTRARIEALSMGLADNDGGYGVNFCFGGGRVLRTESWDCDGYDESAGCECTEREAGSCLVWGWEETDPPFEDGAWGVFWWYHLYGCVRTEAPCVECPGYEGMGVMCCPVACADRPTNVSWHPRFSPPQCLEADPDGDCIAWNCERPVTEDGYSCVPVYETGFTAENYLAAAIPIGIRSLAVDGETVIVPVAPGANWAGTVGP